MKYERMGSGRAGIAALLAAGTLLCAAPAFAIPTLQLSSGGSTVTVADGDANDANTTAGAVTFVGSVGVFDINVSTGITKPANGTASLPDIDLNSVNSSNNSGTLSIMFSETDYAASGAPTTFLNSVGGTTQGTAAFESWLDDSNTLFGLGTQLSSLGPFNPSIGGFSDGEATTVTPGANYSLTQIATITHGSNGGTTSFDFQVTVPAPATLLLLGGGLLGLSFFSRRRG